MVARPLSRQIFHTLLSYKVPLIIYRESGRSAADIARIVSATRNRFGRHMEEARTFEACGLQGSITLNKTIIRDANRLAEEIAKRHLENDEKTLSRIERAMYTHNCFARNVLSGQKAAYRYELNLGKLLQGYLAEHGLLAKAETFIINAGFKESLNFLRETGAIKRLYESPVRSFITGAVIYPSRSHVGKLVESWLGGLVRNAWAANVRLNFNGYPITKIEELAEKIFEDKEDLPGDGKTLRLFQTSLYMAARISYENRGKNLQHVLDLGLLTPKHRKNIMDLEIENFVDGHCDLETAKNFFLRMGALVVERID